MRNNVECSLCHSDCAEECLLFLLDDSGKIIRRGQLLNLAIPENFQKTQKIWEMESFFAGSVEIWQKALTKVREEGSMFLGPSLGFSQPDLALKRQGCPVSCGEEQGIQLINSRIFNYCRKDQLMGKYDKFAREIRNDPERAVARRIFLNSFSLCELQKVYLVEHRINSLFELKSAELVSQNIDVRGLIEELKRQAAASGCDGFFCLDSALLKHGAIFSHPNFRYYLLAVGYDSPDAVSIIIGMPRYCHDLVIFDSIKDFATSLRQAYQYYLEKHSLANRQNFLNSRLERSLKEGRIATWSWNPRTGEFADLGNFEQLLGYTREEILQIHYDGVELVPEEDRKHLMHSLNEHLIGDIPYFSADFRMRHEKGHYVWFHAQGKVVERDEQRQAVAMLGTIQDISEKVEMDAQLRQSQKMEAIGSLASGIAHDFNNLLQVIMGYTEILKDKCAAAAIDTDDADQILEAGEKAMMLVRQLLSFSRVQEQKLERMNFTRILPMMVKLLGPFVGEMVDIEVRCDGEDLEILADNVQIEQLLMSLSVNARDAMPGGGRLTIGIEPQTLEEEVIATLGRIPQGSYVVLSVADTGLGIDPAVQERIFEPFFTTREVGRGTGLGLAMVYSIVKRHGAFLRLVSEKGKGTTFYIYFPRHLTEQSAEQKMPVRALQQATADAKLSGTETILLAEDDAMVRKLAEKTLSQAGYRVISAENGQQAYDKFAEDPEMFDLLVLDMVMPEMSGREAYEKMQKLRARIPVLFASGFSSDQLESDYFLHCPGKLLEKPYQKQNLLAMVRDLLDSN